MKRLSKNEILTAIVALVTLIFGVVGAIVGSELIFRLCLLVLVSLAALFLVLLALRLERVASQQKLVRREIYQVLYWLHGSDKLTQEEAELTREYLDNRVKKMNSSSAAAPELASVVKTGNKKAEAAFEAQRLQFNRLFAVLDAHWDLMSEK